MFKYANQDIVTCFITVDKTAKVQQNLTTNLNNGMIARNEQGYLYYNYPTAPTTTPIVTVNNVGSVPITNPVVEPTVISTEPVAQTGGVFPDSPVSIPTSVPSSQPVTTQVAASVPALSYCPICGKPARDDTFCGRCGFRLK